MAKDVLPLREHMHSLHKAKHILYLHQLPKMERDQDQSLRFDHLCTPGFESLMENGRIAGFGGDTLTG